MISNYQCFDWNSAVAAGDVEAAQRIAEQENEKYDDNHPLKPHAMFMLARTFLLKKKGTTTVRPGYSVTAPDSHGATQALSALKTLLAKFPKYKGGVQHQELLQEVATFYLKKGDTAKAELHARQAHLLAVVSRDVLARINATLRLALILERRKNADWFVEIPKYWNELFLLLMDAGDDVDKITTAKKYIKQSAFFTNAALIGAADTARRGKLDGVLWALRLN